MTIYQGLNFCGHSDLSQSMTHDGIWVLLRTNRLALFKAWEPKAKPPEKQLKLELAKAESILLWHSSLQNLPNGIDSWFQQLYLMASLRMSRRSGQSELKRCIHLTEWSQMAESTDTWLWQSAPCQVAYPSVLLHSHITVSPATCHTVQCRANMRVADCNNCWEAVEIGTW